MLKVSLSHGDLYKVYGDKGALKVVKDCGFDGVDYDICTYQNEENFILTQSEEKIKEYYTDIKNYAQSIGLEIAHTHAPYYFFEPERFFDEDVKQIFINSIKATKYIGADTIVIHPIVLPDPENNYRLNRKMNVEFYSALIPTMEEYGVKVAIENMDAVNPLKKTGVPSTVSSAEKIHDLLDHINHDGFVACLDTGHAFCAGQDPAHMASLLGSRLGVLHLHDNNGNDDTHIPPTFGNINWNAFCKAIKDLGFNGYVNIEVNLFHSGTENFEQLSSFLCSIARYFVEKMSN